ncbi:MAG: transpeptidase family protein [Deltaproteobacteria bacterium]|nr:transpeptidase family protein [Deltaproteobacteria bacterium]
MTRAEKRTGGLKRGRVLVVELAVLLCLTTVLARAVQIQVLHGARLRAMAQEQYLKEMEISAPRGSIYDRNGRALAVSVGVESIYVNPGQLDRSRLVELAAATGQKPAALQKKLEGRKSFAWVKRQARPPEIEAVRRLELPGVHFTSESKRFYPNRELAAHVLGFVGLDGAGLAGLELKYDASLRGRTVEIGVLRDAHGRPLSTGDILPVTSMEGDNIQLTIDAAIQQLVEDRLAAAVAQCNAASGSVLVIEPETGAILALANVPTFNPNDINRHRLAAERNRVISDVFEPGSTLKPIVIAAAIEQKVVSPDEQIFCEEGVIAVGRHRIRDTHPHGLLDLSDIIAKSSNIGALKVGTRLGAGRLHRALCEFGFGEKTGIELPGEVSGMLAEPGRWSKARLATVSFGQGIAVTAMQLASAVNVIANGGTAGRPYLVERVVSRDGTVRFQHEPEPRVVTSTETARAVAAMMERVVAAGGTGTNAAISGIRVAGKTGTAQKVDPVSGGYSADKRLSSFVGFAPVEAPRVLALVVIDEPQGVTYGGVVAAPVFREIVRGTLSHLGVNVASGIETADAPTAASTLPAVATLELEEGAESLVAASPVGSDGRDTVPDLRGLPMRRAAAIALATGRSVQVEGAGSVVEQEPAAGTPLAGVVEIKLRLRRSKS